VSARPTIAYVDSSALVKLIVPEPESAALRTELAKWEHLVSSALARVEVVRACARVDVKARRTAEHAVDALDLLTVDDAVLREASRLGPAELRSLDAIHVASALVLGAELGVAIVYDDRLAQAMASAGIAIAAPR
jgi:predicted nucleic acid-binding protein